MAGLTLVLGGIRSGKSRVAAGLAAASAAGVVVLATGTAGDPEMVLRIARHRRERPAGWPTVEASRDLASALGGRARRATLLVDGLGGIVAAHLPPCGPGLATVPAAAALAEDAAWSEVAALTSEAATLVMVSDEVGGGLVSDHPAGRAFQDALGGLNQRVAGLADAVLLCVAGLPLRLKGTAGG